MIPTAASKPKSKHWFTTSSFHLICNTVTTLRSPLIVVDRFYNYSAILRYQADSLSSHVNLNERLSFNGAFFEYALQWCTYSAVWLLYGWCHVKLLPSRRVLCTPYNHASCHVMSVCQCRTQIGLSGRP